MTSHLQELRDAIVRAVPEIVEWRCEGCNVKYAEYVNGCPNCWSDTLSREENYERFPKRGVNMMHRPIRLSDVLRAMASFPALYAIDVDGNFRVKDILEHRWKLVVETESPRIMFWNLTLDSLNDQSPETIEFLYSIICKV